MPTDLGYVYAFGTMAAFFILLLILGMPSDYALVSTFDFAVMASEFVIIAVACTFLAGATCVVGGAVVALGTFATYVGVGALATTLTSYAVIKAVVLTPITLGFTYIMSKLMRGN